MKISLVVLVLNLMVTVGLGLFQTLCPDLSPKSVMLSSWLILTGMALTEAAVVWGSYRANQTISELKMEHAYLRGRRDQLVEKHKQSVKKLKKLLNEKALEEPEVTESDPTSADLQMADLMFKQMRGAVSPPSPHGFTYSSYVKTFSSPKTPGDGADAKPDSSGENDKM